ncbi:MAG: efflux RND transporter periplasmic adaptor subunit [Candidatus Obscuribacterales bacterium]|nr:efflux RND transporter periplasmic adaptor subunit [Steroidobacteraceae bacterium]
MLLQFRFSALVCALLGTLLLLGACSTKEAGPGQGAAAATGAGAGGRNGRGGPPAPIVFTTTVSEAEFSSGVEALGTAKANEAIDIAAKVSSRITAIRFIEGQYVKRGDVLVELDTDEARADLAVAEAALGESRSQVNRSRELAASKVLSAQLMEQLEATSNANEARVAAARARVNDLIIRAPFNGRVGLRNASVGGLVGPNAVITTLDDISVMKVDFAVPETFLAGLAAGQEIEAKSAAFAEQTFRGRVLSVGSRVDPVTRSLVVRAQVPNRDGKLKPGMFMTVNLVRESGKALVLPEQVLVPEREKQFVFAVRDGKAQKTEVVLGRRRPGEVEILQGLSAGDVVITEGTQKVRDGMPVRATTATE